MRPKGFSASFTEKKCNSHSWLNSKSFFCWFCSPVPLPVPWGTVLWTIDTSFCVASLSFNWITSWKCVTSVCSFFHFKVLCLQEMFKTRFFTLWENFGLFFFFQYKVSLTVYFQASLTRPWKWIGLLELYLLFTISICYCSWKEGHGPLWGKWVISGSQEMLLCAPSCVSFVASVNPLLCTNMDPMDFCRLCEHVRPAAAHDAHLFVLAAHTVALTNHNLWRVAVLRHLALADPLTHWEGTQNIPPQRQYSCICTPSCLGKLCKTKTTKKKLSHCISMMA